MADGKTQRDFLKRLATFLEEGTELPLCHSMLYERIHDDHDGTFEGKLQIQLSPDGDVWVITNKHQGPSLRFRVPLIGGGQSPHVFSALRLLAWAIELDNKKHPQRRPPATEQH
ncbi:MAG: hypothetical protein M3Q73_03150 [bacterium]|nr:hypothetical protein [bacterium]